MQEPETQLPPANIELGVIPGTDIIAMRVAVPMTAEVALALSEELRRLSRMARTGLVVPSVVEVNLDGEAEGEVR